MKTKSEHLGCTGDNFKFDTGRLSNDGTIVCKRKRPLPRRIKSEHPLKYWQRKNYIKLKPERKKSRIHQV
jgi:hypothetical protein